MRIGSLFAGIGGFDLGLERAGMEIVWQVEKDDYCNKVLAKHWPDVKRYGDIYEVGKHNLETVDLICGGFPCQPFSQAGKRKGSSDDRYLWPEMVRVISELKPTWVIGENVAGLASMEDGKTLANILTDLENENYQTEVYNIPAAGVGAWHKRERLWIVSHTNTERPQRDGQCRTDKGRQNTKGYDRQGGRAWDFWATEPAVGRVANGIPRRVDRLKGLGNAVVPQIPEILGRAIMEIEGF